ncbi:MAG: hypothetical protein D6722_24255 [Bacteroidetes bacterium]|nr:MAG: hypothetical protein D6722_24255 [Bacteroidota bacterium]
MAKSKVDVKELSTEELQQKVKTVKTMTWTIGGIFFFLGLVTVVLWATGFFSEPPLAMAGGLVAGVGSMAAISSTGSVYASELKRRGDQ